jgi:osmoprotectant transport system ATP-binding protein
MRRAIRPNSCAFNREVFYGVRESDVRVAAFEKRDQMFAKIRIGGELCHVSRVSWIESGMASLVEFRAVSYRVGDRDVLRNVDLRVEEGETLMLLGRSGSGKTTLLKTVNRLIHPTSGDVHFQGRSVLEWDPIQLRRRIGYVIQEGGLFPHATVERNVGLVPTLEGWQEARIRSRTAELLEALGLPVSIYGSRYPAQLSGGEKQRVGIARALAADPPMLLLDEPFAALDPVTRFEAQRQFLELRTSFRKTALFVTHDIREALMLGSRIALLKDGRIDVAAPADEFTRARSEEARAFLATLEGSEARCPAE